MQFLKPKRPISRVFIHCSASDRPEHDNVATMRDWHKARGWSDVGYHYFIRKDGTLERGRSTELTPAAQAGHNTGTLAVCLHGLDKAKFTVAQFSTLSAMCREINTAYDGKITFHGHNEVAAKACPVFDYRAVLGLDAKGRLGATILPSTDPDDERDPAPVFPTLRRGAKGVEVRALQDRLNIALDTPVLMVDGDFGPATEVVVQTFQRAHHLIPDGIVGPLTWEALDEAAS